MPSIPVPKTLLSLLLLSVIFIAPSQAADAPQIYRFGDWTLIAPPAMTPEALRDGTATLPLSAEGVELLAYWQDGSQRAMALRFDAKDATQDAVVLKSFKRTHRIKGCKFGSLARLKPLKDWLPKDKGFEPAVFPDDGAMTLLGGSARSLRRAGDVLVADLGTTRVQIADDSSTVRLGEWNSADFCRFELIPASQEADEEF
ncbi:MAG: hypothetical protein Q7J29_15625 [Stagnimonas sp.]|nr:hypothetical protein [Stagnimonas sp.]